MHRRATHTTPRSRRGLDRSLEHHMSSESARPQADTPTTCSRRKGAPPQPAPSTAAHTHLLQHRPASRRYTSIGLTTAERLHASTSSSPCPARDTPTGFPRSCQPRPHKRTRDGKQHLLRTLALCAAVRAHPRRPLWSRQPTSRQATAPRGPPSSPQQPPQGQPRAAAEHGQPQMPTGATRRT